jgi:hypothetical protein
MGSDGKNLESFVAFVEQTLVPKGFSVSVNRRVFDNGGTQLAEFDVQVEGRLGSTQLNWLIECRDRPASGPAPSAWIEQLVGRRDRFLFNKVTAVSTTGFVDAAVEYAEKAGIELRQFSEASPEEFGKWLTLSHMTFMKRVHQLDHAQINLAAGASPDQIQAATSLLESLDGDARFLRGIKDNKASTATEAFIGIVNLNPNLWDRVEPNGKSKRIRIFGKYTNDSDHFVIDTSIGPTRVDSIEFHGQLMLEQSEIPVKAMKYSNVAESTPISEVAKFDGSGVDGALTVEIHRISGAEHMYVTVRREQ